MAAVQFGISLLNREDRQDLKALPFLCGLLATVIFETTPSLYACVNSYSIAGSPGLYCIVIPGKQT